MFPLLSLSQTDVAYLRSDQDHHGKGIGPEQINSLTQFCIENGVTIMNYYMLFGGTNFGPRPGRRICFRGTAWSFLSRP